MSAPADDDPPPPRDIPKPPRLDRPAWAKRLAPLVLLAGAAIVGATVFGKVPKDHEVELRLDDPSTVVGIDVTWTEPRTSSRSDADGTPLQGASWRFAAGTAPRSLRTTVRLPDGEYSLEIGVDRSDGHTASRRTVALGDANRITLPVR